MTARENCLRLSCFVALADCLPLPSTEPSLDVAVDVYGMPRSNTPNPALSLSLYWVVLLSGATKGQATVFRWKSFFEVLAGGPGRLWVGKCKNNKTLRQLAGLSHGKQ